MKIDRMLFEKFAETVREDETVAEAVEAGQWDRVIDYVNNELMDKPEEYYTLDNLRKAAAVDRRVGGPYGKSLKRFSASYQVSSPRTSCWKRSSTNFCIRSQAGRGSVDSGNKSILQGIRHQ